MKTFDIIIIGAGALGSALSYHLSNLSTLKIALLDTHGVGTQTSPRAAGMVSLVRKDDRMINLIKCARQKIETFTEELDQPLSWKNCGSLKIARRQKDNEVLEQDLQRGLRNGLRVERISPEEACDLNPFLKSTGVAGALLIRDDCYFQPEQIATGYVAAAEKNGVTFLPFTPATDILTTGNRVVGVTTPDVDFHAPRVVDAAGAWTRHISENCGISIPLIPTRHQAIITEALNKATAGIPMVRIMDAGVYIRTYGDGLLWGVFEEGPKTLTKQELIQTSNIDDLPLDADIMTAAANDVIDQLPILHSAKVETFRGGIPTITPDGIHLLGPTQALDGFYFASGCNVAGLSIAPEIGEMLARWIINEKPPSEVDFMSPDRFSLDDQNERQLIELCNRQYRHFYGSA